jgi:hypothetical protein
MFLSHGLSYIGNLVIPEWKALIFCSDLTKFDCIGILKEVPVSDVRLHCGRIRKSPLHEFHELVCLKHSAWQNLHPLIEYAVKTFLSPSFPPIRRVSAASSSRFRGTIKMAAILSYKKTSTAPQLLVLIRLSAGRIITRSFTFDSTRERP